MNVIELWRPAIGWEGFYEVSNLGSVRGTDRQSWRSNGTVQTWRGRGLTPFENGKGYLLVRLSRPGRRATVRVHRMVGAAFLPPAHTTETINHRDGIKTNNHASNLEWATRRENTLHSIANGLGTYCPPIETRFRIRPLPSPPSEAREIKELER